MVSDIDDRVDAMVREAMPFIARTMGKRFGTRVRVTVSGFHADHDDALECCSRACTNLLAKFNRVADGTDPPFQSLGDYAATAATNVFKDFLRERAPSRTRFSNRIRRVLSDEPAFAVWPSGPLTCAGYAGWQAQKQPRVAVSELQQRDAALRTDPLLASAWDKGDAENWTFVVALLTRVFDEAGGPIERDALIGYLVELVGVPSGVQVQSASDDDREDSEPVAIVDDTPSAEQFLIELERSTAALRQFWTCCQALPRPSLVALLLNLPAVAERPAADTNDEPAPGKRERKSGGRGEISILRVRGVASIEQIGAALDLTAFQYGEIGAALGVEIPGAAVGGVAPFYYVWNHLPLRDGVIARVLAKPANQVPKIRERATDQVRACMTDAGVRHDGHIADASPSSSNGRLRR